MYVIKLTDHTHEPWINSAFPDQKEEVEVMAWWFVFLVEFYNIDKYTSQYINRMTAS